MKPGIVAVVDVGWEGLSGMSVFVATDGIGSLLGERVEMGVNLSSKSKSPNRAAAVLGRSVEDVFAVVLGAKLRFKVFWKLLLFIIKGKKCFTEKTQADTKEPKSLLIKQPPKIASKSVKGKAREPL